MSICCKHGIKLRYDFSHSKSGIAAFGESEPQHSESMKNRVWLLRDTIVDELYEYKNLGLLKNYVGSFYSNDKDNINKMCDTCKKVGLIFASSFDHCKVNPLVYVKLWKQVCLPSLLFGVELWMLTPDAYFSDVNTDFSNIFSRFSVCTWSFATEAFRSEFN